MANNPHVSFAFGRLNPPHYGHEGLINTLSASAKKGAWALFLSKSHDAKKNPLTYDQKLKWVKTLYPQTQGHLVEDPNIKTFLQAAAYLYDKGFRSATFVAGEDDMASMRPVLEQYNGKEVAHGFYKFEPLTFVESPRLTSATNARAAATEGDPEKFEIATRVPQNIVVDGKTLFQAVRAGMGLSEEVAESIVEFLDEPSDGGGDGDKPEFMEWKDFVARVGSLVKSNFSVVEGTKHSSQVKARFVPYDPYEHGPVMIYTVKNKRGRVGVKADIFVGSYIADPSYPNGYKAEYKKHQTMFDMTPANATVLANIINSNTVGALKQEMSESADDKATKVEAKYQEFPHKGKQCDDCTMWRPPHGCTAVSGKIRASGWCKFWEKASKKKVDESSTNENMDHDKDGQAVAELKAALLARKEKLQNTDDDKVYDTIDKIMTRIAKAHGISGQQIHDMWVKEYGEIPDTWIMNETVQIDEAATDILYHYTDTSAALNILQEKQFKLASALGSVEVQYAPKDYNYFLSTARSRAGGYHHYTGTSAVMFVLDGRWINSRYPSKAINYWAGMDRGDRHSETEDRIFSREPTMPITPILAIHVLLKEQNEFQSPVTRKLLIAAKQNDIPTYLYKSEQAWRLQDTRRSVGVIDAKEVLRGQEVTRYRSRGTRWLKPIIDLLTANNEMQLGDRAKKMLSNVKYHWGDKNDYYFRDSIQGIENEFSNARKPGSGDYDDLTNIIRIMRQNRITSIPDLVLFIGKKWAPKTEESINEHENGILGTVGGGATLTDRSVGVFPWDVETPEILDEVNMSPTAIKNFADSEAAAMMTIGFEAEMIVPDLEDPDDWGWGDDDDDSDYERDEDYWDLSKDIPFPTSSDWKKIFKKWFKDGNNTNTHAWDIRDAIDALDSVYDNYRRDKNLSKSPKAFAGVLEYNEIKTMADFVRNYDIGYPYLNRPEKPKKITVQELAKMWSKFSGYKAKGSEEYHSAERKKNLWIFEPDASISPPDSDHTGIELISPPMPFREGMVALDKFFEWASSDTRKHYANESTGFHMGVSIPQQTMDSIDPLKVILLLGDQHILDTFHRSANEYTKSSLGVVTKLVANRAFGDKAENLAQKLRDGYEKVAKLILNRYLNNSGKYVSINVKDNYIEFRSAGGNYFEMQKEIKETMMRYVYVMGISAVPELYRNEYMKKLYKLIADAVPQKDSSMDLFIKFTSGMITKDELVKNLQLKRGIGQWAPKPKQTPKTATPSSNKYIIASSDWDFQEDLHAFTAENENAAKQYAANWAARYDLDDEDYVVMHDNGRGVRTELV